MPRVVSVSLENWPIERLLAARPAGSEPPTSPPGSPLVLVREIDSGGPVLFAVDAAAAALGLRPGERLADARARAGVRLRVRPADPVTDAVALARLCLWATRYAPLVALHGPAEGAAGLFLDVAGADHLLGGEAALLADLAGRLRGFGLTPRLALADAPGAAFALARYARRGRPRLVPVTADPAPFVAPLPVAALRLPEETLATLRRFGLRRVGDLLALPRAPLARRLGEAVPRRLAELLGERPEPLAPVRPPAHHGVARTLLDPVARVPTLVAHAGRLMRELAPRLEAAGVGARRLRLSLHRVDGAVEVLEFGLAEPTRCPDHFARLVNLRLDRAGLDAGFGFETLRLEAVATAPLGPVQVDLRRARERPAALAGALGDALRQRLGRHLAAFEMRASHLPERASRLAPLADAPSPLPSAARPRSPASAPARWDLPTERPLLLLDRAEPVEDVLALMPDGAPRRFRWRRRLHQVVHAEGPERIAPEWWRAEAADPGGDRDYYRVEDADGRRLWLFREGPPAVPPAWFIHGLFA